MKHQAYFVCIPGTDHAEVRRRPPGAAEMVGIREHGGEVYAVNAELPWAETAAGLEPVPLEETSTRGGLLAESMASECAAYAHKVMDDASAFADRAMVAAGDPDSRGETIVAAAALQWIGERTTDLPWNVVADWAIALLEAGRERARTLLVAEAAPGREPPPPGAPS